MDEPTGGARESGDGPTAVSCIKTAQSQIAETDSNTEAHSSRNAFSEARSADGKLAVLQRRSSASNKETEHGQEASVSKRKSFEPDSSTKSSHTKRARLAKFDHDGPSCRSDLGRDLARQLPAEIWHYVFTFLAPRTLGVLLKVNKYFQAYLDPSHGDKSSSPIVASPGTLLPLKPDAIWQASRRRFWPRMPSPLRGRSELDMWRLACSLSCQFCGRREPTDVPVDSYYRGPGRRGVCPIFPFFLSSCAECLVRHCVKELDILLSSSTPYVLLPGLPVVFLTAERNLLPPLMLEKGPVPSPDLITKLFLMSDIDSIKVEFEAVKALGSAATEEWVKGLEARGQELRRGTSRWEKWFLAGGVQQMRQYDPVTLPLPADKDNDNAVCPTNPTPQPWVNHSAQESNKSYYETKSINARLLGGVDTTRHTATASTEQLETPHSPSWQPKRSKEEVTLLKVKRRSEIERRASLLDPPIKPNVLVHIPSFQAALQIISPLDDNAWEILKTRLVAQRVVAEQTEKETSNNARAIQGNVGASESKPASATKTKESLDKEWDDVQGPLRARISAFADEIIKDGWKNGRKVTKKNCAQFATEVLLYVRNRFYAEVEKEAIAAKAAGSRLPDEPKDGPWTRKLTLENIKWVFDLKVKPLAEPYRKDLFRCNGCEATHKAFGFESVVQHYAAKHTTKLSVGSMVVNWRAEWPHVPPFKSESRKGVPKTGQMLQHFPGESLPQNGRKGRVPAPAPAPAPAPRLQIYPEPDRSNGHAPQAPIPTLNAYISSFAPKTPYDKPHAPITYPGNSTNPPYAQEAARAAVSSTPLASRVTHPTTSAKDPTPGAYSSSQGVPAAVLADAASKKQLMFIEKVSGETWGALAPVGEFPSSVKICITIHEITKRFLQEYSTPATLDMFTEALMQCKSMREIRSVKRLDCGVCAATFGAQGEAKSFSLPQLSQHFKHEHCKTVRKNQPDGARERTLRVDMVSLPALPDLLALRAAFAKHETAHRLAADAIPWAFYENPRGGTQTGLPHRSEGSRLAEDLARPGNGKPHLDPVERRNIRDINGGQQGQRGDEKTSTVAPTSDQPQNGHHNQGGNDRPFLQPASAVYGIQNNTPAQRGKSSGDKKEQNISGVRQKVPASKPMPQRQQSDSFTGEEVDLVPRPDGVQSRRPSVVVAPGNTQRSGTEMQIDEGIRVGEEAQPVDKRKAYNRQLRDRVEPRATAIIPPTRPIRDSDRHVQACEAGSYRGVIPGRWQDEKMPLEDYRPHHVRGSAAFVDSRAYEPWERRRSLSPKYMPHDSRGQPRYRDRSPPAVYYPPSSYYPEPDYPVYGTYPEDRYARSRAPVELFEVVEVQDPHGDYFIKRPIQPESEGLAYQRHVPVSGAPAYPQYATTFPHGSVQPTMQQYGSYPSAGAYNRPSGWSEHDEYDPRFPGGAVAPRETRY